MKIVLNDFVVGVMTTFEVYVEIHDEMSDDGEPIHGFIVTIKKDKNGCRYSIPSDVELTRSQKKEVINDLINRISIGELNLFNSVHYDSQTKDFVLFR